jgi:hypothetical protein
MLATSVQFARSGSRIGRSSADTDALERAAQNGTQTEPSPTPQQPCSVSFVHSLSMPNLPAKVEWLPYEAHRKATKPHWDSSRAQAKSKNGKSQYNPYEYGTDDAIRAIELKCLSTGTAILVGGDFVSCYLHVPGEYVGVCCGEFTNYVFAEMYQGRYHGRPVSPTYLLKQHGIKV